MRLTSHKLYLTFYVGLVALISERTSAAIVRHALLPHDSVFSVQTQRACGTYLLQPSPHWCNPALFPFSTEAAIKSDTALSADQDAYDTTTKFLNENIDKTFIDSLFKEQDFQSFSGLLRLEATSAYLSFSYIPVYAVGAYKLSNPNLPEVSGTALRQSEFRLTSGWKLFEGDDWEVYGGVGFDFYDRKIYYINASALDLIVRDVNSLIETTNSKGVNTDLGFYMRRNHSWLPAFSLVADDTFTPQARDLGEDRPLTLVPNYNRVVRAGAGYTYTHSSGSYYLGVQVPYWDAFKKIDRLGASAAVIYGIGRLRTFASYSPLMSAFGFLFMSSHYQVGIEYTSDKQDNSLELKRRKNVYLFVSFNF